MAVTRHEELMERKLAMKIFADFFDTLWVSRLGKVRIKPTWIAFQQVFATTQALPCPCPY